MLIQSKQACLTIGHANRLKFVVFPDNIPTCEPCRVISDIQIKDGDLIEVPHLLGCNGYQVYRDDVCLYANALTHTEGKTPSSTDPKPRRPGEVSLELRDTAIWYRTPTELQAAIAAATNVVRTDTDQAVRHRAADALWTYFEIARQKDWPIE